MKRILLAILAIILCLMAFSGCDKECDHNWERISNYNESTAQDKCTKCGETRLYTDPDIMIPEQECDHNWERISNYNESTAQDKCTKCGETRLYTDPDIMIPEQNTEDCPMQDTVPLIFSDYSDFLLFGSKGEIDISKYPNATIWLQNHEWNVDAFINFKELLDLPDETSKGLTEEIIIEKDNEYTYYVNSKDETNKLKTEYRITIKYDKNLSDKITYQESVAHINSVSDMTERTGSFVYRADSFDVLYYKTEVGYKSVTLVGHNFSIGVHFEGDGLTYPQIASAYGDVISNLFVEDVGVVNQTLYKLSDFILNK